MWTLSGFSDEISPDLAEQCAVVQGLGMGFVEFRSAGDTDVLDLDEDQLARAKNLLDAHGLRVSSIGSPIGKTFVDEDFDEQLARHAVDVAHLLGAPFIRVFSFCIRPRDDPDAHRDEVLRRMRALADVAGRGDVVLLHENEKEIYGDIPRRCADVLASVGSPTCGPRGTPPTSSRSGAALHRGLRAAPPVPGLRADQGRGALGRRGGAGGAR